MDFSLKSYKYLKIKHYIREINFFFFFHGTSLDNANWIKIEQLLFTHNLRSFRILNKLMINRFMNSLLKSVVTLIHGPIFLLYVTDTNLALKKLESISFWISLLCLKLNNKIYSKEQIKNLKTLSFNKNIHLFYSFVQFFIKAFYYKFEIYKTF